MIKALVVGTGGVGQSIAAIAKRRDPKGEWLEKMVMADYDAARPKELCDRLADPRFVPEQVDAGDPDAVAALCAKHGVDILMNLCAPSFNPALLRAALKAKVHYLDTAMTLSEPHPTDPMHKAGVKLGDEEYALDPDFEAIGKYALAGFGVEPGMADFFARYAADHLFDEVDEIGIRDGSNLEIPGATGISFGFSIWTTIEECNNPAIVFENGEVHTIEPFAELEKFWLPEGIGEVEVGHVEHEEVIQIARNADRLKGVKKATFKYALGDEFIQAMEVFRSVNIDKKEKIKVGNVEVSPRDMVAAAAPDPNEIGKLYVGKTAAGTYVVGKKDGMRAQGVPLSGRRQRGMRPEVRHSGRRRADRLHAGHHARAARQGELGQQARRPEGRRTQPRGLRRRRLRRADAGLRVPGRHARDGVRVQARQGPPGVARPGQGRGPGRLRRHDASARPATAGEASQSPWSVAGCPPRAAGHNSSRGVGLDPSRATLSSSVMPTPDEPVVYSGHCRPRREVAMRMPMRRSLVSRDLSSTRPLDSSCCA